MAVEFTGANGQGIQFPNCTSVDNLVTKTISFWYNTSSYSDNDIINKLSTASGGWEIWCNIITSNKITFWEKRVGTIGSWYIDTNPSINNDHCLAISYDNSSVSNDPVFYADGAVASITENTTPSGAIIAETNPLQIGYNSEITNSTFIGKLQDVKIYNRILSADEVAELYNSRMQNKILNGLVFWARLDGANGLSLYDGTTLASANTFVDEIGGAIGTPSGSPVGRGNTIQRIK
jgi:hypothetical protein